MEKISSINDVGIRPSPLVGSLGFLHGKLFPRDPVPNSSINSCKRDVGDRGIGVVKNKFTNLFVQSRFHQHQITNIFFVLW